MLFLVDGVNCVDARSGQCDGILLALCVNGRFGFREALTVFIMLTNARVDSVAAAFATRANRSGSAVSAKFVAVTMAISILVAVAVTMAIPILVAITIVVTVAILMTVMFLVVFTV